MVAGWAFSWPTALLGMINCKELPRIGRAYAGYREVMWEGGCTAEAEDAVCSAAPPSLRNMVIANVIGEVESGGQEG